MRMKGAILYTETTKETHTSKISTCYLLGPFISAHKKRGNPIPADLRLLLTLRYYATAAF